jgi:hypothetical protein
MAVARQIHGGIAIMVMGDAMVMEFGMTMGLDGRTGIVQGDKEGTKQQPRDRISGLAI